MTNEAAIAVQHGAPIHPHIVHRAPLPPVHVNNVNRRNGDQRWNFQSEKSILDTIERFRIVKGERLQANYFFLFYFYYCLVLP